MIRFFHKFKWVAFAAVMSVFAGCSDAGEEISGSVIEPIEPVLLTQGACVYYGYGEAPSCDRYMLTMSDSRIAAQASGSSGKGLELQLDIYAPIRPEPNLPEGRYQARNPMQMGKLYTFELETSFIYESGQQGAITGGAFEVASSNEGYTIKGEVINENGESISFLFSGTLGGQSYAMSQTGGYYCFDAIRPTCDTYAFYLATPRVTKNELALEGMGQALCLNLYAPLESGNIPPVGTYTAYSADSGENIAFKFQPGSGDGALGGLSGTYIYSRTSPNAEAKQIYVTEGTITIEKIEGDYSISAEVLGEDGATYLFSYDGIVNGLEEKTDLVESVPLDKSGGLYLGTMTNPNYDNFSLYMLTEGVNETNISFSGVGMGVYLDLYVPIAGSTRIPVGTYTISATPSNFTFVPGEDMGSMITGSFVYEMKQGDVEKKYIPIVGGSFTVSRDKRVYTVDVHVICSNSKSYKFTYTGKIESILDPLDAVTYMEVKKAEAYYFRDMFDSDYDNWTFALCGEGVVLNGSLAFEGTGTALCFDIYTPLAGNPVFPTSTYLPFGGSGSMEYKYLPGEDYADGMMTGSYVWIKKPGDSEPTYVYLVAGPVSVEKSGDTYTIKTKLIGDDGEEYNVKYVGALTVYDPFADM